MEWTNVLLRDHFGRRQQTASLSLLRVIRYETGRADHRRSGNINDAVEIAARFQLVYFWLAGGLFVAAWADCRNHDLARHRKLPVEELYRRGGVYEYRNGFNQKAILALVAGIAVALIGLAVPALRWLYDYAWFVGFMVSGTPTTAGTVSFTVQVKDAVNNTGTKALSIAVAAAAQPPTVTTASLLAEQLGPRTQQRWRRVVERRHTAGV
jgi:hypothetical protein